MLGCTVANWPRKAVRVQGRDWPRSVKSRRRVAAHGGSAELPTSMMLAPHGPLPMAAPRHARAQTDPRASVGNRRPGISRLADAEEAQHSKLVVRVAVAVRDAAQVQILARLKRHRPLRYRVGIGDRDKLRSG